jgi:hypothetical protein
MERKQLEKNRAKFDSILLESIDQALLSLGENAKSAVYFHLTTKFAISGHNIPDRIDDFSEAIDQIFGRGARQLEILILKILNQKIDCAYHWSGPKWLVPDLTFVKHVRMLQILCEDSEKNVRIEMRLNAEERHEKQTQ